MKRQIRSSIDSSDSSGCWYNVSWYTQFGDQCGECVRVPAEECYDPYSYIEHYLVNTYGDEYGGIADYIETDGEPGDIWDEGYQPIVSSMSEEEQLDQAILDGRPFDIDTFSKYKVDPYRAKGAVKADVLEVGDIFQVTEDAAEIDCPSPELEITDIDYSDPDNYGDDCITFYCTDNETGDEYTLHFWPDEWVGPIIAKKSAHSITSATQTNLVIEWGEPYTPYSGSEHAYHTLYVNGNEVGYIDAWDSDGDYGYTAYLKDSDTQYEESMGTYRSLNTAKHRLESLVKTTQNLIDNFPITSSETINRYSDARPYEDRRYWYFTLHGLGPGTIPSDLTVLDTKEGVNDKGTKGLFICLDGVLNTDELEYYDLKELVPQDVSSASDVGDDDEWSPYHGHNYLVSAGPYSDVTFYCDDPKSAITHWFKYQKKYPTDVAIMCPTKDLALQLVKAGTPRLLKDLYNRFNCPYELDYMIEECKKKVADNCSGFYEGEYGYGDTVHPFSIG